MALFHITFIMTFNIQKNDSKHQTFLGFFAILLNFFTTTQRSTYNRA